MIDESLLRQVDDDPEVKERGRSTFLRHAVTVYLRYKQEREIGDTYRCGYEQWPPTEHEFDLPPEAQVWPDE